MTTQRRSISLDQAVQAQQGSLPYVQPGTSPQAQGYAAGVAARRGLPKYTAPTGGEPAPPMPALEQPHQTGMTMAEQANKTRGLDAQRNVQRAIAAHTNANSIVVPDSGPAQAAPQQANPRDLLLQPGDTLPEDAAKDPMYQQGMGSRMAQAQPHMAAKYGVVRNGKHVPPHELMPGRGGAPDFRGQRPRRSADEMSRDLQQVLSAPPAGGYVAPRETPDRDGPQPPNGFPRSKEEAEAQASKGPGGAAFNTGKSPVPPVLDASDDDSEARAKKMIDELDDFDFERLRREMLSDILKNPRQREAVEARCQPLDIADLIMHNKVRQRVPVLPGRFEPTFESMPGTVELQLKQLLVKESKSIAVTEAYLLDKYAVMTTTAGTIAINGNPLPSMYNEQGDFDEALFWAKFSWVLKRNIHMLASLGIHYSWFEQRVRTLFVADEGKDG